MFEPYRNRIDGIVGNLQKGCSLSMGYFEEPDLQGHIYGPDSIQVANKIEELDHAMGYLLDRLKFNSLLATTNIVLVSGWHDSKT